MCEWIHFIVVNIKFGHLVHKLLAIYRKSSITELTDWISFATLYCLVYLFFIELGSLHSRCLNIVVFSLTAMLINRLLLKCHNGYGIRVFLLDGRTINYELAQFFLIYFHWIAQFFVNTWRLKGLGCITTSYASIHNTFVFEDLL